MQMPMTRPITGFTGLQAVPFQFRPCLAQPAVELTVILRAATLVLTRLSRAASRSSVIVLTPKRLLAVDAVINLSCSDMFE